MIARVATWLRTLLRRRQSERDLADEFAFHHEERSRELIRRGVAPEAARRRARIELGMMQLHGDAVRDARGFAPMDALVRTVRLGWRSPGFTVSAMLPLALPLAAIVMMYAMFATYALHVPPFDRAAQWLYLEGSASCASRSIASH